MIVVNGEAIDVAAPAIPTRDDGSDNPSIHLCHQEGGWRPVACQEFDIPKSIGGTGMVASS